MQTNNGSEPVRWPGEGYSEGFVESDGEQQIPRIEASAVIARPIEDVFAFTANLEHEPIWIPGAIRSEYTSPGPVGVGTTGRSVGRGLGRTTKCTRTITRYEPNRLVTWETAAGGFRARQTWLFEPVPEGTRVTSIVETPWGLDGLKARFGRLSTGLILRIRQRGHAINLNNLKRLLEA